MDKRGSGLSDVYRVVRDAGGDVTFGPIEENSAFVIRLFCRPETIDRVTGTAVPQVLTSTTYAANALEVVELPKTVFHGQTDIDWISDVWRLLPKQYVPPFLLHEGKIFSFHDLNDEANPLRPLVDEGTIEPALVDAVFRGVDGERLLVRMLNESLRKHLQSRIDCRRKAQESLLSAGRYGSALHRLSRTPTASAPHCRKSEDIPVNWKGSVLGARSSGIQIPTVWKRVGAYVGAWLCFYI